MTTIAQMGWLDRIVNVHWHAGDYYVTIDLKTLVNSDQPNPTVSVVPANTGIKSLFLRKEDVVVSGGSQTLHVVWLPTQIEPMPVNPQDQFIPCWGHYTYYSSGSVTIGQPDSATALNNATVDNGILGAWWNTGSRPSASHSAFTSAPQDIIDSGGPFASFTPGASFTSTTAAAFANALETELGQGAFPIGPIPTAPAGSPGCESPSGSAPTTSDWYPTWLTDTVTVTNAPSTTREYAQLLSVPRPKALALIADIYLAGAGDWSSAIECFSQKKHKVATNNITANPFGPPDGKVWVPLVPWADFISSGLTNTSRHYRLLMDPDGNIFVS